MHAWWTDRDSLRHMVAELHRALPGMALEEPAPGFVAVEDVATPPIVAFARQALPNVRPMPVPSIRAAAQSMADALLSGFGDDAPWRLHIAPCYGEGVAGENRCRLMDEAVVEILRRRRRHRLRLRVGHGEPPRAGEAWFQCLLTAPDHAMASLLKPDDVAPWRSGLVPFPAGWIPVAVDKAAPRRAFAKLAEAELRLGQRIVSGQSVVDLGACPGSWTYWAIARGARVVAVDRSPLRDDLMSHPNVRFVQGDAFKFEPSEPVDWLVCDVIAAPQRSMDLAVQWARNRWARRLVVTIKFKGDSDYALLDDLKARLAPGCEEFRLARLCANRNEACVMAVLPNSQPPFHP